MTTTEALGNGDAAPVESEAKFTVGDDWVLPPLDGPDGVAGGATVSEPEVQHLDAEYWDTADLRLARSGATFRRRTGEGAGRDGWTAKVRLAARPGTKGRLDRVEITDTRLELAEPPFSLAGLVRALSRNAPLVPLASLHTERTRRLLRAPSGEVLVELVDDRVTVHRDGASAASFREIEVERVAPGGDDLVTQVARGLRLAGADDHRPLPKLVRALGDAATAPPDLVEPELGERPTAAEVIRAALIRAVLRIVHHDPVVRLDRDPEGVHQMRVGTRRIRSDLRTFRPLVDPAWAAGIRAELAWLAAELGAVRDADVLGIRFRARAAELGPVDREPAARILARLQAERDQSLITLRAHLDAPRYAELMEHLVVAANEPHTTAEADGPAHEVLLPLVRKPWKRLSRAVGALGPDPADADLHQVRILAKRARYAAEAAEPAGGAEAKALAKALAEVQDVLGEHQDAVVAEGWLRGAAASLDGSAGLAAGLLVAVEQAEAAARRAAWGEAWDVASKRRLRRWLG